MRTEYEVYHKPTEPGMYRKVGQFPTLDEARQRTTFDAAEDWQRGAGGDQVLAADILEQMGRGTPWIIADVQVPETDAERIQLAIALGFECGGYDGGHHKQWTIDQMIRLLAGDRYEALVVEHRAGEDGPDTYSWDEGIAP